jgi:hypothetical protein
MHLSMMHLILFLYSDNIAIALEICDCCALILRIYLVVVSDSLASVEWALDATRIHIYVCFDIIFKYMYMTIDDAVE